MSRFPGILTKVAVVAGALLVVLCAVHLGALELFRDPQRARAALLDLGPAGLVAFVLAYGFLQPFAPLPGVVFIVVASLVWSPPLAIALSLAGGLLASTNGFVFARYLARPWVERRVPTRLRKYEERLATRGFETVLVLRLLLWTNQGLNALFGVSRVTFRAHLLATLVAYVPVTVAVTFLGGAAVSRLLHQPPERWLMAGGAIGIVLAARATVRHCAQRRRAA